MYQEIQPVFKFKIDFNWLETVYETVYEIMRLQNVMVIMDLIGILFSCYNQFDKISPSKQGQNKCRLFLSSIKEMLYYLNQARTDPEKFSDYIREQLVDFLNQKSLPLPNSCYNTQESKPLWRETYQWVRSQKPLPPLQLNQGLSLAAMNHSYDMQKNNFFGHNSHNGMDFSQRITKICGQDQTFGASGQNISMEFSHKGRNHALQVILSLVIDDGVVDRGHRKAIFSDTYKYVGLFATQVNDMYYAVMDLHQLNISTVDKTNANFLNDESKAVKSDLKLQDKQEWKNSTINHENKEDQYDRKAEQIQRNSRPIRQKNPQNQKPEQTEVPRNRNGQSNWKPQGERHLVSQNTLSKYEVVEQGPRTRHITTTKYSDHSVQEVTKIQWH